MQIDFLGIQAFLAIVECGSFQLAAAQLHLSQAAISHRLRKLEESLAVRLIARTTREVMLTDAGRAFLPRARGAVKELALSCEALRSNDYQAGRWVAFSCLPTMAASLMTPVLQAFGQAHPDLSVRVFDNSIHEIPELVESRSAAFGITVMQPMRGELVQQTIADEPFVLACRSDHAFAQRAQVRWADLTTETLIRISLPFDNSITIDDAIGSMREQLRWRYETQRHALALQMVREGLGLTVVPRLHVPPGDELVMVPIVLPAVTRTLSMVTRRDHVLSAPEAHLQELVLARLLSRLDEALPAAGGAGAGGKTKAPTAISKRLAKG
ncbi:MAG: LysR substrate-binding domain-containing protein [Polaromonas sp.]|nr:LysR substrate-binding domain-containing protein [Polaromonas sp.]